MSGRATVKWPRALLALGVALQIAALAKAGEVPASKTVMLVCLHGSVKSQMAAAHLNRIARAGGLFYIAVSRGIEIDHSIPTRIRDGLSLDGFAPRDEVPQPLTPADAATAIKVIAFDAVPDEKRGVTEVNYWSNVPPATRDYAAPRDVIVHHIDDLVPALIERARPQQAIRGVVTGIDERNNRLTVRLASKTTRDFRVQDALIFNAVRDGDSVELTVEDIDGAKTVVGFRKE